MTAICDLEKLGDSFMLWCKAYFDILNRLGVTHGCDRQTDRRTDGKHRCSRVAKRIQVLPRAKIPRTFSQFVSFISCCYTEYIIYTPTQYVNKLPAKSIARALGHTTRVVIRGSLEKLEMGDR